MAKVVAGGLLALGLLSAFAVFSPLGASIYPAADRSASVLLGDRAVGPHQNHLHAGQAHAFRMRAYASGVPGNVRVYIASGSTARVVTVGIYSDAADGRPGALLSKGSSSPARALRWSTVPVTPMQLVAGRVYWLALLGQGGTLLYRGARGGPCASSPNVRTDLRELPRWWRSGRLSVRTHCPISAYVLAASAGSFVSPPASGISPPSSSTPTLTSPPADPVSPVITSPEEKKKEEKAKEEKKTEEKKEEKKKEEKIKEEKAKEGTPKECFEDPEAQGTSLFEACGYPGPKDTGVVENSGKTECSSLPEWNRSTEPLSAGATIAGKELKIDTSAKSGGGISTSADDVTLNKDCFLIKGECNCLQEGPAIKLEAGVALTVENSTFRSPSTKESVEKDISFNSSGSDIVAKNDRFEDCGECLNGLGKVEVTDSYMNANQWEGVAPESDELHRENVYMMQGTAIVKDSTMFVPDDETAEIFDEDNGIACDTHVTFEGDFLAGSGQMFQLCGHSNGEAGTGSTIVDHNRVARCLTKPIVEPSNGIPNCSGPYLEGADSHGFMPSGGSNQILGSGPYGATKEFEGNYWDDNLATITVKEAE